MTKTTWTPGPWVNDGGLVNGKETNPRFPNSVSSDIFDGTEAPVFSDDDEWMANSHLIAAAPDLYIALHAMITQHGLIGVPRTVREHALEALAKARGESNG